MLKETAKDIDCYFSLQFRGTQWIVMYLNIIA